MAGQPVTDVIQRLVIILIRLAVRQAVPIRQALVPAVPTRFPTAAADLAEDVNPVVIHLLQTGVPFTQPATGIAAKTGLSILVIHAAAGQDALQAEAAPLAEVTICFGVVIIIVIIAAAWLLLVTIAPTIPHIPDVHLQEVLLYFYVVSDQVIAMTTRTMVLSMIAVTNKKAPLLILETRLFFTPDKENSFYNSQWHGGQARR